ncbi:MAG: MFS transporter [Gammaproteobacteria bacterium]|nr:MFS transporter [Gammaproteobacteria bacterium]
MFSYYMACLVAIMLATFLPQSQAFLLTEYLRIPESEQGVVSGNLNFWGEMVIIATVGLFGALSDRLGRRVVMAFGFLVMGIAFYFYPRATDLNELLLYRLIYSAGIAAVSCMIVTVIADYVRDVSRGKASGFLGVMNGLGAMIAAFVLIKLPARFIANGMSPLDAGITTFNIVMVVALATAIMMWFGLQKRPPETHEDRPGIAQMIIEGVKAARDPGIALAYGASFVARGNLAVVGTFLALWLTTHGTTELGMSAADALSKAGMIIGISYMAAFAGAPLFGLLTDRMSRTGALMITLATAFLGYGGTFFVTDPFGGVMIFFMILVGLSEVGCIITSGVLIAQQSPARIRGSVIGIFNLTGAIGILVASKVGGYLFDNWRAAGPFVFFGCVALIVLAWALLVQRRVKPLDPGAGKDHALEGQAAEAADYS